MLKLKVNDIDVEVEEGLTVLQACEKVGVEIPRFCYHEKLSIAGNCRMCLVEMEKSPKPVASCAMPAAEGMNIKTNTAFVEKARKGVMEFLLANHPLDCPVCDQGGECDLQDQSMFYGVDKSRFKENKRSVPEKNMGPLIKTQMTRCIHCTRCVRFATEIAGVPEIGAIGRGEDMQITTYLEQSMQSELSANVVDLCPVGALTSKPYVFEARPWELKKTESIDVMDAVGSNIRVDTYDWEVKRVLPIINEDINEEWISDKTRYACDGLLNQRLDTPFIKYNGKFEKASWEEVYKIIKSKFENTSKEKVCGFVGDLTNMETSYIFKEFFDRTLDSKNYESRSDNRFINTSKRENYLFNSYINGIDDTSCSIWNWNWLGSDDQGRDVLARLVYGFRISILFGLILTILMVRKNNKSNVAISVALFITAGYWFTSSTSFANPAVTLARTFTDTFTGISPESIVYFFSGQLIGLFIALYIYKFLR